MKIIIVGASGTLGKAVSAELAKRHDIITASPNMGDVKLDMTSYASVESLFKQVEKFDALVCTAGVGHFGPFAEMKEEHFYTGIKSKMMGQINLVLAGKRFINDNGSFTLTSGILAEDPIRGGAGLSFINGAINSFAIAAAIELPRGIRINSVSPGLVEDSAHMSSYFPGHELVPMNRVVSAYVKSVEGAITGQVIKVY
ncbi:short chain dehydrogenase [bacterium]|nr:short chain dehydrogenase [bacterium]